MNPILITGSHRSGKSWLRECLMLSGQFFLVHEPFSTYRGPNHQSQIIHALQHIYTHIDASNEEEFAADVQALLHHPTYRFRLAKDRGLTALNLLKCFVKTLCISWQGAKCPLIDDPFVVFAADWLCVRFGIRPILVIRNPASFVAACRLAGYSYDFSHLIKQKSLMNGKLERFASEVERAADQANLSDVAANALLWKLIYSCVATYQMEFSEWIFLRFEDLAANPTEGVAGVYSKLSLPTDLKVQRRFDEFFQRRETSGESPMREIDRTLRYPVPQSLHLQHTLLNRDELKLIQTISGPIARQFYADKEWL